MTKAFTKGEEVTYINGWDSKGTFYFVQATVFSCGKKQMVLTGKNGEEMGRNYTPTVATVETFAHQGTFKRMTDEEARAACLTIAAEYLVAERARLDNCIARHSDDAGYCNAIRKDIDALHEPRCIEREGRG